MPVPASSNFSIVGDSIAFKKGVGFMSREMKLQASSFKLQVDVWETEVQRYVWVHTISNTYWFERKLEL